MQHLPLGTILNNNCYRIQKVIGQGGFGITYLADEIGFYRNTGFGDTQYVKATTPDKVVIKELYYSEYCDRDNTNNRVIVTNGEKKDEFLKLVNNQLDEGKKLRMLNHPNVVITRDIFKENDTAYMVMEFLDSFDLDVLLEKSGKLPKQQALKYITEILSALKHVHEHNQLHLDIKPSNILIRKNTDEAVLIDFGASQSYDKTGNIVGRTSQLIGGMTKCYAPNEQADIDNLKHFDATFDTYAAGATLYHLLTGQAPPASSLLSTGRVKLTPPSELCEMDNDYVDAIISKALAPLYHSRFKSADEFITEINNEANYRELIRKLQILVENKDFDIAKSTIKKYKNTFLTTHTLEKINSQIINNEERNEREKLFTTYTEQGQRWIEKKEFLLAIASLEKALTLKPDNKEIETLLNQCRSQIIDVSDSDEKTQLIQQSKELQDDEHTILVNTNKEKNTDSDKTVVIEPNSKRQKPKQSNKKSDNSLLKTITAKRSVLLVSSTIVAVIFAVILVVNGNKTTVNQEITVNDTVPTQVTEPTDKDNPITKNSTTVKETDKKHIAEKPQQATEQPENKDNRENSKDNLNVATEIKFNGKKYEGKSINGVPDGLGTLYFNSEEIVSEYDDKKTVAQAGDYLKGKWNNGELEYGILYDKSGNKKATLIIGRY